MIIILDDIGGSKSRDGARARARTGTPTFFLGQTEARRAEKNDFRSRISLLSLSLGQSNNEEFKFATWKTRRELEPKCVPQKLLGSLLGTRRSVIGQFFPLALTTFPEVFAKVSLPNFSLVS